MDVSLVLFKKDGSQKTFSLPSAITVIGRRHDCDLCIPLMVVSRRHCQLNYNNEALKIRDLGSRAGTLLNGKPIDEATVRAGDYIKVGNARIPYDPEVLAKAVKKVMKEDEYQ